MTEVTPKPNNYKQILMSIFIGCIVAFFTTLFQGLADLLRDHGTQIISGGTAAFYHIAKNFKT